MLSVVLNPAWLGDSVSNSGHRVYVSVSQKRPLWPLPEQSSQVPLRHFSLKLNEKEKRVRQRSG